MSYVKKIFSFSIITALMMMTSLSYAVTIKIGVLAPDGTTWGNTLKKVAKEVKKATNGNVKFKMYLGGVQGDEPDVLRKIRVGQMHGGIFTGRALGEIYGDIRAVEIPFSFHENRTLAFDVLQNLKSYFNLGLNKNGFKNLGFFEVGLVYVVSTKKINSLDDLKGRKIWAWMGDEVATSLVVAMNLVAVPLALPDVLSSLSTGVIDTAYSTPLGMIALQWNSKIKYLVKSPVAYSIAAFLVSKKQWNKIPAKYQKIVEQICSKYVKNANLMTDSENTEALATLKSLGVKFVDLPEGDKKKAMSYRKNVVKHLVGNGKVISDKAFKMVNKEISKLAKHSKIKKK